MLLNTTIEGLKTLRLDAMAAALAEQHEQAAYSGLGFDERLGLLADRELTERSSRRLERCLKTARLRATIVTSQLPVSHWHEAIGDPTIADAALDRLLENAHRIELAGESMRQAAPAPSPQAGRA